MHAFSSSTVSGPGRCLLRTIRSLESSRTTATMNRSWLSRCHDCLCQNFVRLTNNPFIHLILYIIFRRYCTKCKGIILPCYRTCKKHMAKNPSQTGPFSCVDADDFHKTDLYVSIKGRVAPHLQGNKRRLKKARTALFKGMRYQNSNMERD